MAEMVKCKVNGQFEIVLPKHRADRPEWYTEKGWEKERLKSMHGRIDKGDIVIYCGSEEGEMCALLAMWGAEVVLIEPNVRAWPNTKAIWEANNLPMPLACFVGFASDHNSGRMSVTKSSFPDCANGEVIPDHGFMELRNHDAEEIRLDALVEILHINPKHISIDCEGAEGLIVDGMMETLAKHKPIIWLSGHPEFCILQYNTYLHDIRQKIKNAGYREVLLDYSHEVHLMFTPE